MQKEMETIAGQRKYDLALTVWIDSENVLDAAGGRRIRKKATDASDPGDAATMQPQSKTAKLSGIEGSELVLTQNLGVIWTPEVYLREEKQKLMP